MADPTTFDARLADAFERYFAEAPTAVDAAGVAASATVPARPQVVWRGPWSVLTLRAVLLGLLVAVLAGGVLIAGSRLLISPSVEPAPSSTAASGEPVPEPWRATWWTDQPANLSFGDPSGQASMRFTIAADGSRLWITTSASALMRMVSAVSLVGRTLVVQTLADVPADRQHIEGDAVAVDGTLLAGCHLGDVGRYDVSEDAVRGAIRLTAQDEACPSRRAVLDHDWLRSLSDPNRGGIATTGTLGPGLRMTLPAGEWDIEAAGDIFWGTEARSGIKVVIARDAVALGGGCLDTPDTTPDSTRPRATRVVDSIAQRGLRIVADESATVSGYVARRLVVGDVVNSTCFHVGLKFGPIGSGAAAILPFGGDDEVQVIVVEGSTATFVFAVSDPAGGQSRINDLVNTIHFLNDIGAAR